MVLDDGLAVFLYPPPDPEARRGTEEIASFEHQLVDVTGLLYPTIPEEEGAATLVAPCLAFPLAAQPWHWANTLALSKGR